MIYEFYHIFRFNANFKNAAGLFIGIFKSQFFLADNAVCAIIYLYKLTKKKRSKHYEKILIAFLVLVLSLSFVACGNKGTKTDEKSFNSLQELANDPEFQQIFEDGSDENFKVSVSADSDTVLLFKVTATKTYNEEDVEYLSSRSTEEISEKFALADLQKTLKMYGFGDVTIDYKMYNGDGTLITERTIPPKN